MAGNSRTIVDTGAIFAMLDKKDQYHDRASKIVRDLPKPFYTCESVISETCFLLENAGVSNGKAFGLISAGVIELDFRLDTDIERVSLLMKKYDSVPMSLADACLLRMSEIYSLSAVFTFDSDFSIYRRNGREAIQLIPESQYS